MPQILEPVVLQVPEDVTIDNSEIRNLFSGAYSEIDQILAAKRAVFQRYLDTRVNWLRMQLLREADSTDSLTMNHLEFLRIYKPHMVPEEYRCGDESTRIVAPPSALRVIKTVKRATARSKLHQTPAPPASKIVNSTPFRTPATGKYPLRARRTTTTNAKNTTRLLNTTNTISRTIARPVRTAASKKLQPTLSVFDLKADVLYTSSGVPVANPLANLPSDLREEIKRMLKARKY
ncbi:unnamed protein product [Hymenolepis diminuta]|uniref:Nbl1_Borealin_N domain-containing protein n=1 Tax=Hymenolepis diminuta TaxID=6216 RepID=A0A0R3SDF3_HYMDI|nr:unnamed protein product [Hymenolepis diminuta]VUZ41709.1 unnamed protein product [Hymenolepis diminuta]